MVFKNIKTKQRFLDSSPSTSQQTMPKQDPSLTHPLHTNTPNCLLYLELLWVEARLQAPLRPCPGPGPRALPLLLGQPPLRLLRRGHAPDALDCGWLVVIVVCKRVASFDSIEAKPKPSLVIHIHLAHAPVEITPANATSSSAASASSRRCGAACLSMALGSMPAVRVCVWWAGEVEMLEVCSGERRSVSLLHRVRSKPNPPTAGARAWWWLL